MQYDSWAMFEARAAASVVWTWPLDIGPSFFPSWWPSVLLPPKGGWGQALVDLWEDFWSGLRSEVEQELDGESFEDINELTGSILTIADARAQADGFDDFDDWLTQFDDAPGEGAGG